MDHEQHQHSQPADQTHPHVHDHADDIKRLKYAEGHLRGIQRMLEEDAYCVDVIRQIQAVQAALAKVSARILDGHLNSCVITAIRGEDQSERERVLKELLEIYNTSNKS
jgi:DNA-binding FrmR family transcriptional regulator